MLSSACCGVILRSFCERMLICYSVNVVCWGLSCRLCASRIECLWSKSISIPLTRTCSITTRPRPEWLKERRNFMTQSSFLLWVWTGKSLDVNRNTLVRSPNLSLFSAELSEMMIWKTEYGAVKLSCTELVCVCV